ncbi:hypothetical protein EB118_06890 [bacterium]|nr:hypothetical protein [bacterium]
MANVNPDGKIILPQPPATEPQLKMPSESPITEAGDKITEMSEEQSQAVQKLGGEIKGGKRRKTRKHRGGSQVVVSNPPHLVSAGQVDADKMYANMLRVQNLAETGATYDNLTKSGPVTLKGGKRRGTLRKSRLASKRLAYMILAKDLLDIQKYGKSKSMRGGNRLEKIKNLLKDLTPADVGAILLKLLPLGLDKETQDILRMYATKEKLEDPESTDAVSDYLGARAKELYGNYVSGKYDPKK